MARMGHDSERAAMIYQHEALGADKAITNAIDTHVGASRPSRAAMMTGQPVRWTPQAKWPANGPDASKALG
jgi:hypothetical protein